MDYKGIDWNSFNNKSSEILLRTGRLLECLSDLGFVPKSGRGSTFRGPCPVHEGRNSDGFSIETTGGYHLPIRWICFSRDCQKDYKESFLGLVRGILSAQKGTKVHIKLAADHILKYINESSLDECTPILANLPKVANRTYKLTRKETRSRLIIPSKFFVERGFSPEILDRFDVGYSQKLMRAVIPLYDDSREFCIGYIGRSHRPVCDQCGKHHTPGEECRFGQPKWMLMSGFPRDSYLYNFAEARTTDCPFVFLVEGVPDVLRLAEAGLVGVAILGSSVSDEQHRKLAALGKEIWAGFDNDRAGTEAYGRFCSANQSNGHPIQLESSFPPRKYKDFGEVPVEELRQYVPHRIGLEIEWSQDMLSIEEDEDSRLREEATIEEWGKKLEAYFTWRNKT